MNQQTPNHGPGGVNHDAVNRLKNIEGQVRGIQRMVEADQYCIDIVNQIAAARAALKQVGLSVLRRHVEHCVADAIHSGGSDRQAKIDELMLVLGRWDG